MKDRVPTEVLPNGAIRYGVYNADGSLNRYEYIKAEDNPTEEGTPLNKANLLSDETANALGLSGNDATVNNGLIACVEGRIGDIVHSQRTDFLSQVGTKYLPCDGQIIEVIAFPKLTDVVTASAGIGWHQTGVSINDASAMCKTSTGRLLSGEKYSDDNGQTWITNPNMPSGCTLLFATKSGRILAGCNDVSSSLRIYKSDDDGNTWTSTYSVQLISYKWYSMVENEAGELIACANDNTSTARIIKSSNNGDSWTNAGALPSSNYGRYFAYRPQSSTLFFVARYTGSGNVGRLYKSTDFGGTWTQILTGLPLEPNLIVTKTGRILLNDGRYSDDDGVTFSTTTTTLTNFCQLTGGRILSNSSYSDDNGKSWVSNGATREYRAYVEANDSTVFANYGYPASSSGLIDVSYRTINIPNIPNHYIRVQ